MLEVGLIPAFQAVLDRFTIWMSESERRQEQFLKPPLQKTNISGVKADPSKLLL